MSSDSLIPITRNFIFINNSFYYILKHLVSKFYSGCLQEVMFIIPYSYYKVNYSKTTSPSSFEIIPEDLFARCNFLSWWFEACTMWNLKQTHLGVNIYEVTLKRQKTMHNR